VREGKVPDGRFLITVVESSEVSAVSVRCCEGEIIWLQAFLKEE
jgi:hypothetical protein